VTHTSATVPWRDVALERIVPGKIFAGIFCYAAALVIIGVVATLAPSAMACFAAAGFFSLFMSA
jgi:hypothetical protein